MSIRFVLALVGSLAFATTALAADVSKDAGADGGNDNYNLNLGGTYRVSGQFMSDMRVDGDGRLWDQHRMMSQRLSFTPELELFKSVELVGDVQLLSGYLAIDAPDKRFAGIGPPRGANGNSFGSNTEFSDMVKVRKLYVSWRTPIGLILAGRTTSDWGSGMLANGGDREREDWGEPKFGQDRNYGDLVNRLLFATRPLQMFSQSKWAERWLIAVGGDVVQRDERTDLDQGDLALQGIGAIRYNNKKNNLGLYVAHRNATDRNNDTLQVWAYDVAGEGAWRYDDLEVSAKGELAWVTGETTVARNNCHPTGPIDVAQLGYFAQIGAKWLPWGLGGDVQLGYASGDSNPCDDNLRNFTFDPHFQPSLIMFSELRGHETIAAVANASDPGRVGVPPSALRYLPTNGAVTNAIYVRPTVRYNWGDLNVRFAFLWAIAEEDIVDPFSSTIEGGVTKNFQGGDGSQRELGYELNLGVDYTFRVEDYVELFASVQGGHMIPGDGFADASGTKPDPITMAFMKLAVSWLPPPAE